MVRGENLKILLLNQAFYPDVVSTAQHLTDLAIGLSERGHEVTVIAAARGYDDPKRSFPGSETWRGIRILRVRATGFGKSTRWRRAADFASFLAACAARLAAAGRFDVVVALTSPPLISVLGAAFARMRRARFVLWMMDLNPDEALAAGWLRKGSLAERVLERLLRWSLEKADAVVVLDRFMRDRVRSRGVPESRLIVLPPWSHDDRVRFDPEGREVFRREHAFGDRFVVMYSGNHSPCHPLTTLVEAAKALASDERYLFCFVGGGSELPRVEEFARKHALNNVRVLPYQPIEALSASLSAADLQVVVMGDPFVGIVHPSKVYNILAVGAPILYIGPPESHVTDLADDPAVQGVFRAVRHNDVEGNIRAIREAREEGGPSRTTIPSAFSPTVLLPKLIAVVEGAETRRVMFEPRQ